MKTATDSKNSSKEIAGVVHRNIHAILEMRREHERKKSFQEHFVDRITRLVGSIAMLYCNLAAIALWIGVNSGFVLGVKPFDPYPFALLGAFASIEAIFLATFVLISQNRAALLSEKRADLDVQINLLSEHEITRLIQMVDAISVKLGIDARQSDNIEELKKDVAPETLLETIENAESRERRNSVTRQSSDST
jgi:uncharacterized membrane protein